VPLPDDTTPTATPGPAGDGPADPGGTPVEDPRFAGPYRRGDDAQPIAAPGTRPATTLHAAAARTAPAPSPVLPGADPAGAPASHSGAPGPATPSPAAPAPAAPAPIATVPPGPGAPGAPAVPGPTLPTPGDPAPARVRIRRTPLPRLALWLGGAGALVLLLVLVGLTIGLVNSRLMGPQRLAQDYLDALADGRAADALALVPSAEDPDADDYLPVDTTLLTDEAYAAATDRPTGGRVTRVERDGATATLTLRYRQGGSEVTQQIEAERVGTRWGIFDRWELRATVYGRIALLSGGEGVTANDVALPDGYWGDAVALPGTYTFRGGSSQWLDGQDVGITVAGTEPVQLRGPLTVPTEALRTQAGVLVEDFLARCVAATVAEPEDCPIAAPALHDASAVTWTLDVAPEYRLVESALGDSYTVRGTAPGSATATGVLPSGDPTSVTVPIDLLGEVRAEGDTAWYSDYSGY
jgi:hypothetical protein